MGRSKTQRYFSVWNNDEYLKQWFEGREKWVSDDYNLNLLRFVDSICESKGYKTCLDVGIGFGEPFARHFLERGYEVYGIDISEAQINYIKNTFPQMNVQVNNAMNMKFPDETFDVTYCFQSSWYFSSLLKAIDEMYRVTKKGGKIFFDIRNAYSPRGLYFRARSLAGYLLPEMCWGIIKKREKPENFSEDWDSPFRVNRYLKKSTKSFKVFTITYKGGDDIIFVEVKGKFSPFLLRKSTERVTYLISRE